MILNIVYKEMLSLQYELFDGSSDCLIGKMILNIVYREMVSLQYEFFGVSSDCLVQKKTLELWRKSAASLSFNINHICSTTTYFHKAEPLDPNLPTPQMSFFPHRT